MPPRDLGQFGGSPFELPPLDQYQPGSILAQAIANFPQQWMQMKMYADAQKSDRDFKERQLQHRISSDEQDRADDRAYKSFVAEKSIFDITSQFDSGAPVPTPPVWGANYDAYTNTVVSSPSFATASPEMQSTITDAMSNEKESYTDANTYFNVRSNVMKMVSDPSKWYIPEGGQDFPTRLLSEYNKLKSSPKKMELEQTVMKAVGTYNENMRKKNVYENMVEWQSKLYGMEKEHVKNYRNINPNDIASKTTQWNQFAANWAGIKKLDAAKIKDEFTIQLNLSKNLGDSTSDNPLNISRQNLVDNEIIAYRENPDNYLQRPLDEKRYYDSDGKKITLANPKDEQRWRAARNEELLSQELTLVQAKLQHLYGAMGSYNTNYPLAVQNWENYINNEIAKPATEIKDDDDDDADADAGADAGAGAGAGDYSKELLSISNQAMATVLPDSLLNDDGILKKEFQNNPQIIERYSDEIKAEIKRLQGASTVHTQLSEEELQEALGTTMYRTGPTGAEQYLEKGQDVEVTDVEEESARFRVEQEEKEKKPEVTTIPKLLSYATRDDLLKVWNGLTENQKEYFAGGDFDVFVKNNEAGFDTLLAHGKIDISQLTPVKPPGDTLATTPLPPVKVETKAVKKVSSAALKNIDRQIARIDKSISNLEERIAKAPNEKMKQRIQNQIDRYKARRDKLLERKSGGVVEAKPSTDSNFRTYLEGLFSEPSEESIQAKARVDKFLGK